MPCPATLATASGDGVVANLVQVGFERDRAVCSLSLLLHHKTRLISFLSCFFAWLFSDGGLSKMGLSSATIVSRLRCGKHFCEAMIFLIRLEAFFSLTCNSF